MPLYSSANPPKALTVGDWFTLLDGTETLPEGAASMPCVRATSPSGDDAGITFNATGMPADSVIDIQVAGSDVAAEYSTSGQGTAQLIPDANGNAAYTDTGRSPFFRLLVSSVVAATGAKVKANR